MSIQDYSRLQFWPNLILTGWSLLIHRSFLLPPQHMLFLFLLDNLLPLQKQMLFTLLKFQQQKLLINNLNGNLVSINFNRIFLKIIGQQGRLLQPHQLELLLSFLLRHFIQKQLKHKLLNNLSVSLGYDCFLIFLNGFLLPILELSKDPVKFLPNSNLFKYIHPQFDLLYLNK